MKLSMIILAAAALAVSCAEVTPARSDSTEESFAEWSHFGSLTDLAASSDVIARVAIVQKVGEPLVPGGRVPVAFTAFQVRTLHALKGQPTATFTVLQLGRRGDPANTYPEFPLLTPGAEAILFLRDVSSHPNFQDGTRKFQIVGLEGAFIVAQGRVKALSSASALRAALDGTTASDFEALLVGSLR